MDALAGVTFRSPVVLAMLVALPLVVILAVRREQLRRLLADRFVSERLRGVFNRIRPLRPWLVAAGLAAAVIALGGPQIGSTKVVLPRAEASRIIVLDVSRSMDAEDVGASRLAAAKAIARQIVEAHEGRAGLVIFENSAEIVSPLTSDLDAVSTLLDSVEAGELADPGSNLGAAIDAALDLARFTPGQKIDVVLLSDGEDQGKSFEEAVTRARRDGIPISTIVIGTESGSTIPARVEGGKLRDESGSIVMTAAHGDAMQRIAARTGGKFLVNPFAEGALAELEASGRSGPGQIEVRQPIDRYQWPLALAFVFFVCGSIANRGGE